MSVPVCEQPSKSNLGAVSEPPDDQRIHRLIPASFLHSTNPSLLAHVPEHFSRLVIICTVFQHKNLFQIKMHFRTTSKPCLPVTSFFRHQNSKIPAVKPGASLTPPLAQADMFHMQPLQSPPTLYLHITAVCQVQTCPKRKLCHVKNSNSKGPNQFQSPPSARAMLICNALC